ncbi:MAG: ABC transporter substrate-binding protein [Spirochaetia bacterium]|jgi:NitT/TauT family transport system substrate-binding protein|nr:ABC transporter substrate-binding protein [Spirochaetia bacterium]
MTGKTMCVAALLAAGVSFSLCAKGAREEVPPNTAALTLQVAAMKGPTGIGMIKMFRDRPPLGEGVGAEYTAYASPEVLVPRLVKGELDVAALPGNLAANLYNRGAPYRLAAVIGNGVLYLVSTDPSVDSLESLAGKTLQNVARGATPEFVVRHILREKGLEASVGLRFQYNHAELAQLLVAGRETTAVLPEPFATKVLRAAPGARIVADFQKEWAAVHGGRGLYPMSVLVAKKSLYEGDARVLGNFLAEFRKSQEWVLSRPGEAGVLAEKLQFGLSAEEAAAAIPRCNLVFEDSASARSALEEFLGVFLDFAPESIGGKLPDEGFYKKP